MCDFHSSLFFSPGVFAAFGALSVSHLCFSPARKVSFLKEKEGLPKQTAALRV